MKREKKVVMVIVEGPSDENAIGGVLKEYFSSKEVQFAVVHGDITSDFATTKDNVLIKIGDKVEEIRNKYGYRPDDFVSIIHITDTDGAFTKDCIRQSGVKDIQYYEDHIEADDVSKVEKRNKHKSEILSKLYSTGKVKDINYRIYFNSCNLEHVLYDELKDFTDEEKQTLSDDFAEEYEGEVEAFIEFISNPDFAVIDNYKNTWRFIEKDMNSLHRHSNMHLIFK
ncbi:MAG: hypothetical protein E6496_03245 [Lachnoanaerobaculum sp.]|nr:hypothetical protein [Lachnoanaerobaculum sp.]